MGLWLYGVWGCGCMEYEVVAVWSMEYEVVAVWSMSMRLWLYGV